MSSWELASVKGNKNGCLLYFVNTMCKWKEQKWFGFFSKVSERGFHTLASDRHAVQVEELTSIIYLAVKYYKNSTDMAESLPKKPQICNMILIQQNTFYTPQNVAFPDAL